MSVPVRHNSGPMSPHNATNHVVPDSARRSARAPSFSAFARRESERSTRQDSIAPSVIGTSTPTLSSYRRRREKGNDGPSAPGGEDEWADVEPDEVFRRLPVNEVKRVESKMRSEALNKQSELRLMVGTRYRDLLTSATQITSLHSSSIRLSDSLREIARSCVNPDINFTFGDEGEGSESAQNDEDVVNMLPVAAHMKLLLDAPEALYSFLAHQAFLNAAFLWLITRVVKEGLSNMPKEQNSAYLPLLQKQWETLLPFRAQIVQRATASLRTKDKLDPRSLSETLLSIILLDNLPLPDALSVFLAQRTKAIHDTLRYAPLSSAGGSASLSPGREKEKGRKRSDSRIQAANASREAAHGRESISSVLTDAVHALLETVVAVKAVFEKRRHGPMLEGEGMLEEMMRLVQKGEIKPSSGANSQPPPARRTSHQRRASRLASISLPIPNLSPSVNRPPVSAPQILQGLPSSQILLRHLPNSITGFTPFISPSSTPSLSEKLDDWQNSAIDILAQAVPAWLAGLKNVSDIWAVRTSLGKVLADGAFEVAIKAALEGQWGKRVQEVWDEKFEQLLDLAEKEIQGAADKVRIGGEKTDTNTDSFLFSDLTFPSAPATAFSGTSHGTAFNTFCATLKKRIGFRTPSLDGVLVALEQFASDLKADMRGLPEALYATYEDRVKDTLRDLVDVLDKVLASLTDVTVGAGKEGRGVEAELLVGRVALYLAKSSTFLSDIAGQGNLDNDGVQNALLDVHSRSTRRWRERAVQEALVLLAPLFEPYRGAAEIRAGWQAEKPTSPSHPIFVSLQSLVSSAQQLGIPPDLKLPIVHDLLRSYVSSAQGLEGWGSQISAEAGAQAAVDIGFLVRLAGGDVKGDEVVTRYLDLASQTYPNLAQELESVIDQSLRRSQLLLYPLLSHLETAQRPTGQDRSLDNRHAALLRFGVPAAKPTTGGATEYRSPVVIAKPGKRMGLLSIAA